MKRSASIVAIVAIVVVGAALGALILRTERRVADVAGHADSEETGAEHAAAEEGPHGGRLLRDGSFAAEVTIFERGVPPELRLYFYDDGEPIEPSEVSARVTLERLGGKSATIELRPQADYLRGSEPVEEPHSFDVTVDAAWRGREHRWTYGSYEGRVRLTADAAARAGIEIATAGPATLETELRLNGRIVPNEDRLAHVLPRFAGIVRDVRKHIGDPVAKGEVMAVVQSNQSLQSYDVRSELAGTVIQKHVTPGEYVAEGDHLYTVANLETVWVDLDVYRQDFPRIAVGQPVVLDPGEGLPQAEGQIDYISPFGSASTQTMLARVILPNPALAWRPGFFVTGEVMVERAQVPLAVRAEATQTIGGATVVFLQDGDVYQAQPVELGRRDDRWVEVLSGIEPGQRYVARNSFVLKADVGKSGARHEH
ncbi:MAG: efflux RND transporter periplasmic adaptor subunit [Thermodesulfobacteriota bacterium]